MPLTAPAVKPANPNFSSGPCAKRPGWTTDALKSALVGRSHRAKPAKARIEKAIALTRELLEVPADYRIGIVPASDTGAVEMFLWSALGARGVDMLAWESFGEGWVTDVQKQLKLDNVRVLKADYGYLPDLKQVNFDNDVVFTWNGTTSGVRVPNADWIPADRKGLTICDATSAAFAQNLDFKKLDVVTFSWQKALGGEAAHGVLILSPRAVERLETYKPDRPLPKLFRLTKGGKLMEDIFEGATINTVSMLCIEDAVDAMEWGRSVGGLKGMQARADANFKVLADWVAKTDWIDFLAQIPETRSNTSVCFTIVDPAVKLLDADGQAAFAKAIVSRLDKAGAAYDIGGYRDAPTGLRIWAGSTVEAANLKALTEWLDWAFATEKAALKATA
ncbi:MAG: phosphoserine aminotransferase [Devosia sp. 67-54]|uniref:phosphoserine transaminase n=1 Tax=unclassified Devosia TaxID=196773 RepID=UPI00095D35C5|nr:MULTISPECIES: phosphoserine transaminase [unclassified Devosia]MBN9306132.1 phosphoserine transaminase [Devosia sp.]OJX16203.1 MAG: phosphoserine aminotransferase [Devosia sp. 67-54]